MSILDNFERMLAQGRDSAMLRYSLGNEYLKLSQHETASRHLEVALTLDPDYSAAWKLLGKCLAEAGDLQAALSTFERGIEKAQAKGDLQAAKEMQVFAKRLKKQLESP